MGSVKDLVLIEKSEGTRPGRGRFVFSDRYSVFDWGEMPDHIEGKGSAICLVTAYFFEKLEDMGFKTHYIGLVEDGKVKRLKDLEKPSNVMEIKLLRVLKPEIKNGRYDYSIYKRERFNFLIPLEIIYRNSLPPGSSVFRRLKEGSITYRDLGLDSEPVPGQKLKNPVLDVSTKLEETDRYIKWEEAKEIAGLTDEELKEIKEKTLFINNLIIEETKKLGFFNEDGKVEYGFDEKRNVILVDALGTLDECRFTYEGIPVSKEIARIYYRKTDWYKEVESAKKKDRINWKDYVENPPPKLPEELKVLIENIYKSYANEITKRKWFKTPPFKEIIEGVKKYI